MSNNYCMGLALADTSSTSDGIRCCRMGKPGDFTRHPADPDDDHFPLGALMLSAHLMSQDRPPQNVPLLVYMC